MIYDYNINSPLLVMHQEICVYSIEYLIGLLSFKNDLMVLHSAVIMPCHGRYSYVCFDAFASFTAKGTNGIWNGVAHTVDNPFDFIQNKLAKYPICKHSDLPDFQGGAVGYFGYEASHYLETLSVLPDNIKLPDIHVNFYSTCIAIDHVEMKSWIIATGYPAKSIKMRHKHAKQQILDIQQLLNTAVNGTTLSHKPHVYVPRDVGVRLKVVSLNTAVQSPLAHYQVGPITSNFTQNTYEAAVLATQEHILNGDIFEANLTQQFRAKILDNTVSPLELYLKIIKLNPAPYSAFCTLPNNCYIISASPERFIKLTDTTVETCPIKGTRRRTSCAIDDRRLACELQSSVKDNAEHVMIVDLMRNDLSKICKPGHVRVDALCALKSFETVHHLVSTITGELDNNLTAIDVLKATFPPGSVTGAPKIRAMEVISELEQQARGPYCGCLGYISFTGDMDTSVIIRSYFINTDTLFFSAGGAIVLDSQASDEYHESMLKAAPLIKALNL